MIREQEENSSDESEKIELAKESLAFFIRTLKDAETPESEKPEDKKYAIDLQEESKILKVEHPEDNKNETAKVTKAIALRATLNTLNNHLDNLTAKERNFADDLIIRAEIYLASENE